jgi:hypothetical protein
MLRSLKDLTGYPLTAKDGEIGQCLDFLFDDRSWTIRYMVADSGTWRSGQPVLISPVTIGAPHWRAERFPIKLTRQQIKDCPSWDAKSAISRQQEIEWFNRHRWPYYWQGPNLWGPVATPAELFDKEGDRLTNDRDETKPNPLHSINSILGFSVQAEDGGIGLIEDFFMDDNVWNLPYLVIDTKNLPPARKILISPSWGTAVDWQERSLKIDLPVEAVKTSPAYDPSLAVSREYEKLLFEHYDRPNLRQP